MLFNSLEYLIFLPIVVFLYWMLPKMVRSKNSAPLRGIILLIASYVFYMAFKPEYLILLLGLSVFNWLMGFAIHKATNLKKAMLIATILIDVGTLAYFKYTNFVLNSFYDVLNIAHISHSNFVLENIILPLGISFFTFEFLHYVVDVYKGGEPVKSFVDFALLPGFFPSQIAGPIKRYQDFVPQMENPRPFDAENFDNGFVMVWHGLAKKVLLADSLAIFVNVVYAQPAAFTTLDLWLATYAFAYQVYCDFSGYTDVAIGSAKMMNISVPPNFNVPYMANNIRELWHRQHISLSFWFRDYVYIPLGGSRCSTPRIYFNLLATTALAGLWHGAAWHFVAWGAFQGMSLIVHREWMNLYKKVGWLGKIVKTKVWHAIAIFITFQAFAVSFVYFRADNLKIANAMLGRMLQVWNIFTEGKPGFLSAGPPSTINPFTPWPLIIPTIPFVLAALMIAQILSEYLRDIHFWAKRPRWMKALYCAILIILMLSLMPDQAQRFLYFQF